MVPPPYRQAVLTKLHDGHPRMARMKSLARMYVWWPGISADIKTLVRKCHACQQLQSDPAVAHLRHWSWPTRPWARLHLDYAGLVDGKMFLILTDAHSKWIEAFHTKTATSAVVVDEFLLSLAFLNSLSLTMAPVSQVQSSSLSYSQMGSTTSLQPPITPHQMVLLRGLCR